MASNPFLEGCVLCSTPYPSPPPGTPLYPKALCSLEPAIGPDPAWPVHPSITQHPSSDLSPCRCQGWDPARGRQSPESSLRSRAVSLTLGKEYPQASPTGLGFLREWVQSTPGREELGSSFLLLCDQEELGSMMNHCCSFWRSIFYFFLRTGTRAQKILHFLNFKTSLIGRSTIDVTAGLCFVVVVFFGEGEP